MFGQLRALRAGTRLPAVLLNLLVAGCGMGDAERMVRPLFEQAVLSSASQSEIAVADHPDTVSVGIDEAMTIVGVEDGSDEYLFQEIADIEVDVAAGEMFVLDKAMRQVLVYSIDDGTFHRRIGRLGQGPGEFQDPTDVFFNEHAVLGVWDPALRRVSLFESSGNVLWTGDLPDYGVSRLSPLRMGRLAKKVVPMGKGYVLELRSDPLSVEVDRQTLSLLRLHEDLRVRDTLLQFRAPPIVGSYTAEGGGQVTRYDAPPVFSPEGTWAVRSDGLIAFAPGGEYQIALASSNFEQPLLLKRSAPRLRVSRSDRIRRLRHEAANPVSGIPKSIPVGLLERLFRGKFSPYRPAIMGLLWDGSNRLWVRRFDAEADPTGFGGIWDVVDWGEIPTVDAHIASVLRFEDGITPLEVIENRVYAVQRDSLGVQRVVILAHPRVSESQ